MDPMDQRQHEDVVVNASNIPQHDVAIPVDAADTTAEVPTMTETHNPDDFAIVGAPPPESESFLPLATTAPPPPPPPPTMTTTDATAEDVLLDAEAPPSKETRRSENSDDFVMFDGGWTPAPSPPSKKRRLVPPDESTESSTHHHNPSSPSLPAQAPSPPVIPHPLLPSDVVDRSSLARSFRQRLFRRDPSPSLADAYSRRDAAAAERDRIRSEKKSALRDLRKRQRDFELRKGRLLELNSELKVASRNVGDRTREVFDLELVEPCPWNDRLRKLRERVAKKGGEVPGQRRHDPDTAAASSTTNANDDDEEEKEEEDEEERTLAAFVGTMRNKVKKGHPSVRKHPHRIEALEALGVRWESGNEARFDVMFRRLLDYKKEHGTFRMPSLELCKESGDEELVALHNWVFSQVGSFRYQLKSKKAATVKRFLDVGFTFEKWYATNGHVFERNIPKFDDFCRRYVENGGRMDAADEEALREASARSVNKMRRNYKKKRKKKGGEAKEKEKRAIKEEKGGKKDAVKMTRDETADMTGGDTARENGEAAEIVTTTAKTEQQREIVAPISGAEGTAIEVEAATDVPTTADPAPPATADTAVAYFATENEAAAAAGSANEIPVTEGNVATKVAAPLPNPVETTHATKDAAVACLAAEGKAVDAEPLVVDASQETALVETRTEGMAVAAEVEEKLECHV